MTIEIIDIRITDRENGTVQCVCKDVSEERLQFFERYRDDVFEEEITFEWNTKQSKDFYALRRWLKQQKATNMAKTFGEAMEKVIGTICESPSNKYRVWEY